ncbi:MAG: aldo/keto reductase [Clostridia bacterium]|nr:aldo/keto reductase [Clostridia bacterium]
MKNIKLNNGLSVSEICLGAMMFGTTVSKEDAYAILDAYLGMGGNFIDTSNNYAHWAGTGDESETLLGEWLRDRGCRERVVIATKVGFDRHGSGAGLKREQIEYWCEESLRKLGTDYIDLYYAHTDDPDTPMEETLEAFDLLIKKGKVRVLGGSNYDTWRFAEFNQLSKDNACAPYSVMQQRFSYLHCRHDMKPNYIFNENVGRERLRYLENKDIPLVAYSSLIRGAYEDISRLPENYVGGARFEVLANMAKEKGVTNSALAVAWMCNLHRMKGFPRVIPLFSSSNLDHFKANCAGAELVLSDEEMAILTNA